MVNQHRGTHAAIKNNKLFSAICLCKETAANILVKQ
jgi:hypothetical protein